MLIDSHCHIPHRRYEISVEQLVKEAVAEGVTHIIAVGTSLHESVLTLKATQNFPNIRVSIGVYPHDDKKISFENIYLGLEKLYVENKSKVVGVGECGIDISEWKGGRSLEEQKELFKLQVGFAVERGLPLIIHNRNGDSQVLEILEKYRNTSISGVMHCYSSDWETAKKLLDLNFYISFSGRLTYPSVSQDLVETALKVPSDRYLIETDAPMLPPQGHRGEINYPKYVKITAEKIAEIRKVPFEQVAQETFANTARLFKLNI